MDHAPDTLPQQYTPRLLRAVGLVAVGAAMHVLLPQQGSLLLPQVAPQQFVYLHPAAGDPPLLVERTTVFAPHVAAGDGVTDREARVAPAASLGVVGADLSVSLTGTETASPNAARTGASGEGEATGTAGVSAAPAWAPEQAAVGVPVSDERSVPLPQIALVTPAVLRTPEPSVPRAPALRRTAGADVPRAAADGEEEARVRRILDEYAVAYERLDVVAAKALYPSVDGNALKKAFKGLSSQRLTLQSCGITISGSRANARCQASATYHPKIGRRSLEEAREWTFDLSKKDAAWSIVDTFVR